ncbi:MAG: hypothetical protein CMH56_11575 [Myxococcales bacterium]|nr:hypothetical protein [Myxococcales bacterium]
MTGKKGRRASERRTAKQNDEARAQGEKTEVQSSERVNMTKTVEGASLVGSTDMPTRRSQKALGSETQTRQGLRFDSQLDRSASSRFRGDLQSGQLNPDQEFRRAVLDAEEDLPDTAVDDGTREDNSFLNGELEVLSGEDAEQIFPLLTYPTYLGRDEDGVEINLKDTAISQRHLSFSYIEETGRWEVSVCDGAGNGALVNDVRINQAKSLHHGDIINVGRTRLRFFYRSGRPSQAQPEDTQVESTLERKSTSAFFGRKILDFTGEISQIFTMPPEGIDKSSGMKRGLRPVLALALLGGMAFGVWAFWQSRKVDSGPVDVAQIEALLRDAQNDLKGKNIFAAETKIKSIAPLAENVPSVKSFLRILNSEKEALNHLEKAKKMVGQGDDEALLTQLAMIPDSSSFSEDRDGLRAQLQKTAEKTSTQNIERLIRARQFERAEKAIAEHRVLWGDGRVWNIAELRKRPVKDSPKMKEARALLLQGALSQAIQVLDVPGASAPEKGMMQRLDRLQTNLEQGQQALKGKSGESALKAFQSARKLYRQASRGADGVFSRGLAQNLANAHYLVGATVYVKNKCKGAQHFIQANSYAPDDAKIKQRLTSMRQQADQILREARAEAATNPTTAKAKASGALCLVPKGSKLHNALRQVGR